MSLRRSLMVFYIISFCIMMYGFLGFFLLSDVVDHGALSSLDGAMYYGLLLQSTMGVFTNEAQPYYEQSRWTAVYYVSFSLIGNLLLAKLVIAVGYASYRTHLRSKLVRHVACRQESLLAAWQLLSRSGAVPRSTWTALCAHHRSLKKQVLCQGR